MPVPVDAKNSKLNIHRYSVFPFCTLHSLENTLHKHEQMWDAMLEAFVVIVYGYVHTEIGT